MTAPLLHPMLMPLARGGGSVQRWAVAERETEQALQEWLSRPQAAIDRLAPPPALQPLLATPLGGQERRVAWDESLRTLERQRRAALSGVENGWGESAGAQGARQGEVQDATHEAGADGVGRQHRPAPPEPRSDVQTRLAGTARRGPGRPAGRAATGGLGAEAARQASAAWAERAAAAGAAQAWRQPVSLPPAAAPLAQAPPRPPYALSPPRAMVRPDSPIAALRRPAGASASASADSAHPSAGRDGELALDAGQALEQSFQQAGDRLGRAAERVPARWRSSLRSERPTDDDAASRWRPEPMPASHDPNRLTRPGLLGAGHANSDADSQADRHAAWADRMPPAPMPPGQTHASGRAQAALLMPQSTQPSGLTGLRGLAARAAAAASNGSTAVTGSSGTSGLGSATGSADRRPAGYAGRAQADPSGPSGAAEGPASAGAWRRSASPDGPSALSMPNSGSRPSRSATPSDAPPGAAALPDDEQLATQLARVLRREAQRDGIDLDDLQP